MTLDSYPHRDNYFAHRFVRTLHDRGAAQDIGTAACYLLCIIAHAEDAGRYRGPAKFWNSQLMETLGFTSPKQLNAARERAVSFGWLHYDRAGTRAVGEYFVLVPDKVAGLSDVPIVNKGDAPIPSQNGKNRPSRFFPNSTQIENGSGNEKVTESGKPSYPLPIPNPSSCPATPAVDEQEGKKAKAKKPIFTPEDLEVATWFYELIKALDPERKAPKLDCWANDIRLMREVDRRTHEQIREMFECVQRDRFWRNQVLSPAKLREKWDDLRLRLGLATPQSSNGSIYKDLTPASDSRSERVTV